MKRSTAHLKTSSSASTTSILKATWCACPRKATASRSAFPKKAIKRGINFEQVGYRYIEAYKSDPNVLNVKVIFVTDPSLDFKAMLENAKKADAITNTLTHIMEGLPTDCTVCQLKDICDEVEGMKELHFGVGDKGTNAKDHH